MASAVLRMLNHLMLLVFMLAAASCAESGENTNIAIGFGVRPPLTAQMLHATATLGDKSWQIDGKELAPAPGFGHVGPRLSMPAQGTLTFSFVLIGPAADTISQGSASLELRRDWNWGLSLEGPSDDGRSCAQCAQYVQSFPLAPAYRNSDRDSVWVVWTGLEH